MRFFAVLGRAACALALVTSLLASLPTAAAYCEGLEVCPQGPPPGSQPLCVQGGQVVPGDCPPPDPDPDPEPEPEPEPTP